MFLSLIQGLGVSPIRATLSQPLIKHRLIQVVADIVMVPDNLRFQVLALAVGKVSPKLVFDGLRVEFYPAFDVCRKQFGKELV
jgi:hypothetical protein